MSTIRRAYVDIAEGQVHYRRREGGDPPILFLHQTASSSASYEPLMKALRVPNRLVAIDTPGFGQSFDPPGRPSMADYAGCVLAVADALGIERFHVFGHHTGASLALELAATVPDRILSVMLAGPLFMTEEERFGFSKSHGEPIPLARDGSHLQANWDYSVGYNKDCPVELLHQETLSMLRANVGRAQAYSAVAAHDAVKAARNTRAPALLLSSKEDYFYSHVNRARALFPNAPVAITGGGNFQPAADSEGSARAVESFLAALPG